MLHYCKFCFIPLKILLTFLVKIKIIPNTIISNNELNQNEYIIYLMQYKSIIDLIVLHIQCITHNLPDPLKPCKIKNIYLSRYLFINKSYNIVKELQNIINFKQNLNIDLKTTKIDIKIIPITIMLGRSPSKKNHNKIIKFIKKFFSIIFYGRDSILIISKSISLNRIINMYYNNKLIIYKLIKIANNHFIRQRLISIGPKLINRKMLFKNLLKSTLNNKFSLYISKKNTIKNKKNASKIIKEIIANYSYCIIFLANHIMNFMWNKIYKGIYINKNNIRNLALCNSNIIYVPCHRSHMDYLLISYVLYHQGLMPPHIASGINLNFWPIGYFLRKLGAFFIRRKFNVNKFYSSIFREYLYELFKKEYSIEYFIEGGRSRTGYLLNPKTGMLTLTLQSLIKNNNKKVLLIPIYIAYDKIIEINTYSKELFGHIKKRENLFKMLGGLLRLRNLGKAYVNFGQPLNLNDILNKLVPNWNKKINNIDYRPNWMVSTVQNIANNIMININKASYVNEINLSVTALLASQNYTLTRKQLIKQIKCYINFLLNVPYSNECIIPKTSAEFLFDRIIYKNNSRIIYDNINEIVILPKTKAIEMLYYRNNIHHMLIMPELIAMIIYKHYIISKQNLLYQVRTIYPILKKELFLHWDYQSISVIVTKLCNEFINQGLIIKQNDNYIYIKNKCIVLKLFTSSIKTNIQRYYIIFSIIKKINCINRYNLKTKNDYIAKHIILFKENIHKFEFFNSTMFNILLNILKEEGYITLSTGNINIEKIEKSLIVLSNLLDKDIKYIIDKYL